MLSKPMRVMHGLFGRVTYDESKSHIFNKT